MNFYMLKFIFILLFSSLLVHADLVIAFDNQNINNQKKPTKIQKVELDKLKKIALENNIEITFKAIPWKRSLLLLEKGMIDGVIQASYKIDRAKYANYPITDGEVDSSKRLNDGNSYYIYRNSTTPLRWDGKNFIGSGTVAAMDKYAVIDDLKKHQNISIKLFNNNAEIIRKVASGDLDAYAGSISKTDVLLKKYPSFAKKIVRESLPIRKKDYFLIFSKIKYKEKAKDMETIWVGLKQYNEKSK